MRNNRFSLYISILISILFLFIGIRLFLSGSYLFAVIWMLIIISMLYQNIMILRKNKRNVDDLFHEQRKSVPIEKERLQKVEDLYRSGLISKEEYEKKREDILNSL